MQTSSRHYGSASSRNCTVQCESECGSVLVLARQDLLGIMQDFPHFGDVWYIAARNREQARITALSRHTRGGLTYRHFAAYTIQRLFRAWRKHGALGLGPSG